MTLALPPVKIMGGKRLVVPNVEEKLKESEREPIEPGKVGAAATVTVNVDDERKQKVRSAFVLRASSRFGTKVYPSGPDTWGTLINTWSLAYIDPSLTHFHFQTLLSMHILEHHRGTLLAPL